MNGWSMIHLCNEIFPVNADKYKASGNIKLRTLELQK